MLSFKIHNSFLDLSDDVDQLIGQKLLWNLDFLKAMEKSQSVGKGLWLGSQSIMCIRCK